MIIKYGLKDNNIDVTSICYDKLKSGIFIIIPNSDHARAKYFTDPYKGKLKSIFIINETDINNQIEYDHSKTIYINTLLNKILTIDEINTVLNEVSIIDEKLLDKSKLIEFLIKEFIDSQ